MRHVGRMIFWGVLTGWVGLMAFAPSSVQRLEEALDLAVLFKLRGPRSAPPEVVIVNIDPASARQLNLPVNPSQWPRDLHARLIETLTRKGARTITFDVVFRHPRDAAGDDKLARAVARARNVVLCGYLEEEIHTATGSRLLRESEIYIERLIPPIAPLSQTAAGVAPFPLPKQPVRLNQFWAFKTSAGEMPSLPVMTFQVYAAEAYGDLYRIMGRATPELVHHLSSSSLTNKDPPTPHIQDLMRKVRQAFKSRPDLVPVLKNALKADPRLQENPRTRRLVSALIDLYGGADSRYINYYGPPETIPTIPYAKALGPGSPDDLLQIDFKDKAVFVGLSERIRNDQADGFYTIFSQRSGLDISGVEVAASVFANLMEEKPVKPLTVSNQIGLLGGWGLLAGAICLLAPLYAAVMLVGAGALYFFGALQLFSHTGVWLPLTIPLLIQTPFAFLGTQFQRHFKVARERRNIRQAFGYHLPATVVDRLAQNFNHIREDAQDVYGICLFTDARRYTTLSETMPPEQLSNFLNHYYQRIFKPVQDNEGIVSDVKGDSMLALWSASSPDPYQIQQACRAALAISQAVNLPTTRVGPILKTRIGIHAGNIRLGHIGAAGHYEYRPVGDIVNTASRIEGLNKHLGTDILISDEIALTAHGFFTRLLGAFLVAGKTHPVTIYELVGETATVSADLQELSYEFSAGIAAFRQRNWPQARRHFQKAQTVAPEDRATQLYLKLCHQYQVLPPDNAFTGVIVVGSK
jgi:adenylate cyclase